MEEKYQFGFALGRDHALSIAEICAHLEKTHIKFSINQPVDEILIVTSENKDLEFININNLGGTIKLFRILGKTKLNNIFEFVIKNFYPNQTEKRINFGISSYGLGTTKELYQLGKNIKEYFSKSSLSARFVASQSTILSSVIITENKLLDRGFEVILIKERDEIIVGQTISTQDYKAYSFRDFGRPRRDDLNGMIPPKLAQIMINLSKINTDQILYDPFCGSGTILQEADLLGYQKIYGSDINKQQIRDTKANLAWLEQNCYANKIPDDNLFISDILNPSRLVKTDAIVSEGYLGEPIRKNHEKATVSANSLAEFYLKALNEIKNMLNTNGKIVIAIPFFIVQKNYVYLPLLDRLEQIGLKIEKPLSDAIKVKLPGRGNLSYHRPEQFVGREILILQKK
ncbi:MAG: DNA methyltransferase [Patescibacteria group bacterium]|jgi:tRNA G10  N-methylase Trm11